MAKFSFFNVNNGKNNNKKQNEEWEWVERETYKSSKRIDADSLSLALVGGGMVGLGWERWEEEVKVLGWFYVVKRYLAYRAVPPFAAISGTVSS